MPELVQLSKKGYCVSFPENILNYSFLGGVEINRITRNESIKIET